ncbi:glutaredoxin [Citrobacter phage Michonne]|uniref:Glutaredoxin n=15 Tax=Mooglevirus TaxID=1985303 RepID=A0A291AY75_9CAUD|nr:glutaredoxin [Citrobacter phage Moogle]YP_009177265.1 glutaredoxin [Citrobacter phage Michonne]YP_009606650.1 glutaredoxin [Citrobacter phage Mordin]YP_009612696.1 glutaredoxin [Shigella phage Sf13]YP_009618636.1 glutaredoxin [Shigella phage Sf14]YP_009618769.1 glutaredoxin [Shigella phage Sf17]ARB06511.1 glutaredoxin [Citrobacter phage Mijalis]ATE85969.1 glutaredoxin [Shigella phage Sf15]ATE86238.1 glutaredoxin [Shigella phage Sf16]ATE86318.1 putative glutaredoxin [Shigella phage Sf18]
MTYVIYSKDGCPQCVTAKNFAQARGLDHVVRMLGKDYELSDLMDIAKIPVRQMPFIMKVEDNEMKPVGTLQNFMAEVNNA